MVTRCKFKCISKTEFMYSGYDNGKHTPYDRPVWTYEFTVVYGDGSPENQKFFASTPSGNLKLQVVKDNSFVVGKEYYIDLSEA